MPQNLSIVVFGFDDTEWSGALRQHRLLLLVSAQLRLHDDVRLLIRSLLAIADEAFERRQIALHALAGVVARLADLVIVAQGHVVHLADYLTGRPCRQNIAHVAGHIAAGMWEKIRLRARLHFVLGCTWNARTRAYYRWLALVILNQCHLEAISCRSTRSRRRQRLRSIIILLIGLLQKIPHSN